MQKSVTFTITSRRISVSLWNTKIYRNSPPTLLVDLAKLPEFCKILTSMNKLVRTLFETFEHHVFSVADIKNIEPNDNIRYGLVKRAMESGDVIQLKRGLYTLSSVLRKQPLNLPALSNRLYYPSYVSFEYALSAHGWIPESVIALTCATSKNPAEFDTAVGLFSYKRVPQVLFFNGVEVVDSNDGSHLQALPLKALADYIYVNKLHWMNREPLIESLRIEEEDLATLTADDFESIQGNYATAPNVEKFLAGLKKDLNV